MGTKSLPCESSQDIIAKVAALGKNYFAFFRTKMLTTST